MRLGILTGGGDAPGLNAAIRAVARRAFQLGSEVSGVRNGWAGCVDEGDIVQLTAPEVRGILQLGGTILGTSRVNPLGHPEGVEGVARVLRRHGLEGLVAIGGDDTLSVARALHLAGFPVVGVPKTIDNDLDETEFCIGFDTALGVVVDALDRLHTTASSHHRVMVVEVMGRNTGWVAMIGGLAGGADVIIIPEFPITVDEIAERLYRRRGEGKDYSIIVIAEGVAMQELVGSQGSSEAVDAFGHVRLSKRGVGDALSEHVEQLTGFETRVTVLGHLQRGGSPSATDRIWATWLGVAAAELIHQGRSGTIPIRRNGRVEVAEIQDVIKQTRRVPREIYELGAIFG